jgi:hypothetical protein
METITTHISLSGKRVPCGATKRRCPRKGHQIVAASSATTRNSQERSVEKRNLFIAEIKQAHAAERAEKNEAAERKAEGLDWDNMTSEEQKIFTQQQTEEEIDAFRRAAFAQVTDPFDLARMVNQAPSNDSALFETLSSNAAVRPETLEKILKRNSGKKKVYDLLLANPNTPERARAAILDTYSQAR